MIIIITILIILLILEYLTFYVRGCIVRYVIINYIKKKENSKLACIKQLEILINRLNSYDTIICKHDTSICNHLLLLFFTPIESNSNLRYNIKANTIIALYIHSYSFNRILKDGQFYWRQDNVEIRKKVIQKFINKLKN